MSISQLKEKAKNYEFYSFGTTRIFEKRASKLKSLRTWITFLGLVTPVVVGGAVLSFGFESPVLPIFLTAAGVVGIIQLVLSTWSIVARWDETYEYAVESLRSNTELYNQWKSIKDETDEATLKKESELLVKKYEEREFKDLGQNITDKEKRFANHETLKYYKQECHVCNQIPKSIKATKCSGCGNF